MTALPPDDQEKPRVAQALILHRLGFTYAEIAHQVGWASASTAMRAIKKAEAGIIRHEGRALIQMQLSRIDFALSRAVMPAIARGNPRATEQLVMLLKREAELLGLDARPNEAGHENVTRRYEVQHDSQ